MAGRPVRPTGSRWSTRRRAGPVMTWWPRPGDCSHNKKIGHAGTLDPDATGVLVLGVGRVTRLLRFLSRAGKTYETEIVLGVETRRSMPPARSRRPTSWTRSPSTRCGRRRRSSDGPIMQVPPMVSALKVEGRRLHELARAGVEVERKPDRSPCSAGPAGPGPAHAVEIEVECSSGTCTSAPWPPTSAVPSGEGPTSATFGARRWGRSPWTPPARSRPSGPSGSSRCGRRSAVSRPWPSTMSQPRAGHRQGAGAVHPGWRGGAVGGGG